MYIAYNWLISNDACWPLQLLSSRGMNTIWNIIIHMLSPTPPLIHHVFEVPWYSPLKLIGNQFVGPSSWKVIILNISLLPRWRRTILNTQTLNWSHAWSWSDNIFQLIVVPITFDHFMHITSLKMTGKQGNFNTDNSLTAGEFLHPFINEKIPPPIAPIAKAPPQSSTIL